MKYEFSQVSIKGFGGSFQNGVPMLIVRWKAIFNKKVAQKLGVFEDLFKEDGKNHSLRKFTEHGLPFFIDEASIAVHQHMDAQPLTFDGRVKKLAVITEKEGTELTFQTQVRLDSAGLLAYMVDQNTEPAPKMVIQGKQLDLFDDQEPPPAVEPAQQEIPE